MFVEEGTTLEDRIAAYSAHLAAGMAGWLELVAEFDRRETYLAHDCISTAEWLGWRCGIAKRAAREHVRIARRLEDLPLVASRFRTGELSYSKVRALTRAATQATEASLVELASGTSAAQLERICSSLRRALSIDEERIAYERRHLNYFWEDDGSLSLHGLLSGEEGALFVKALELARELLQRSEENPERTEPITNADAITAMAESLLANGSNGSNAADRHKVIVHVDEQALSREPVAAGGGSAEPPDREGRSGGIEPLDADESRAEGSGAEGPVVEGPRCRIEDGAPIARETARRLTCDASIVEIKHAGGEPLSVGRSRRTVPAAIRRALKERDGRCRYPGCTNYLFVDAHHVDHWADGGETSLQNLVLLCRRHHRLLHEGAYTLVEAGRGGEPGPDDAADSPAVADELGSDDGLRFVRPNGIVIEPAPAVPRSHPSAIVNANRARGIDPGSAALNARHRGDRLDMHLTIGGLCDREQRDREQRDREASRGASQRPEDP